MSFTTSPIINRWEEQKLPWHTIFQPDVTPLVIPAQGNIQLPQPAPLPFYAKEGSLLNFGACFDNPACGLRYATYEGIDTGNLITINNSLTIGLQPQGLPITIAVPPISQAGFFCINGSKEQTWKVWCRLYLINVDVIPHNCLVLAYQMAMLDK